MSSVEPNYAWSSNAVIRSPMSLGYRAGLAVVSVTMVLLPAIYVLFCVGVAYGIYYYATNFTFLLSYHQAGIVGYFGPILAGGIGIVFMVKPLFTRPEKRDPSMEITRESQPVLFQFIDEVCARVGAPRPVRVRLDNRVNAAASFEHGFWGMLRRRLVLTIGLPLTQGLTVSQFGGVLAHEFGHFTQAAAMRFSYVIRLTNGWFSRVIYERDSFDAHLASWSKRGNIYWMIMANIATAFVWVARKILWLLMRAGHAVSAYLMRQMEYDADYYEQVVTGSHNYRETFLLLRVMNIGAQLTGNHLNQLWKNGRLVTNVPMLTQRLVSGISEQSVQQLRDGLMAEKEAAPWYATHPSDPQRIARSTRREEPGILAGDKPAALLFADFDRISRDLTLIEYRENFQLNFKPESLVPTESYLEESMAQSQRIKSLGDFFGGVLNESRLLFPQTPEAGDTFMLEEARARYRACANQLEGMRPATEALAGEIEMARTKRAQAHAAQLLAHMGVKIEAANFGLKDLTPDTTGRAITETTAEIDGKTGQLAPAVELAQTKLHYFCRMAESYDWIERVKTDPNWTAYLARIAALKNALIPLRTISDLLNESRKPFFLAGICLENFNAAKNKPWTEREFEALAAEIRPTVTRVEELARSVPYPLQDGKNYPHLAAYFVADNNQPGPVGTFTYLRSIFERNAHLYTEIMLELLEKTAAVEKASAPPDAL